MKKKFILFHFILFTSCLTVQAQENLLQSGPMVGYSTFKEVLLWVQTTQSAKIHFVYFAQDAPQKRYKTDEIITQKKDAFIARIIAEVQPSKKYQYELYINNKLVKRPYPLEFQSQTIWKWHTDPPEFKFAFGSCNYVNETEVDRPGKPYGDGHQIFQSILDKKPDFMIWGGDNTYLREVDWDSHTGILHRYTHTRSLPQMQAIFGSVHHYAIWDDHEYGPNDADRSYALKKNTLEAFKLFWGNPTYALDEGITGQFAWGDAEFFLMDDRYFRSPNDGKFGEPAYLGEKQLQWMIDALTTSEATFKFVVVGGQVLNSDDNPRGENYSKYASEREKMLKALREANIRGVIFLTGDRHHTELSKMERGGTYPLYDFTISPLTAGPAGERGKAEKNIWRVPDTYFGERNFALFEVKGKRGERILTASIFNTDGKEIWKKEISEKELK